MTVAVYEKNVLILIASGFEEPATICCMARLREASVPVSLVGLSTRPVSGWHGLSILPDKTLDLLMVDETVKLVIIPGGQQCALSLLTDPRVYRLLAALSKQGGSVAVMETAVSVVTQSGLLPPSAQNDWVAQGGESIEVFVENLLDMLID